MSRYLKDDKGGDPDISEKDGPVAQILRMYDNGPIPENVDLEQRGSNDKTVENSETKRMEYQRNLREINERYRMHEQKEMEKSIVGKTWAAGAKFVTFIKKQVSQRKIATDPADIPKLPSTTSSKPSSKNKELQAGEESKTQHASQPGFLTLDHRYGKIRSQGGSKFQSGQKNYARSHFSCEADLLRSNWFANPQAFVQPENNESASSDSLANDTLDELEQRKNDSIYGYKLRVATRSDNDAMEVPGTNSLARFNQKAFMRHESPRSAQ